MRRTLSILGLAGVLLAAVVVIPTSSFAARTGD